MTHGRVEPEADFAATASLLTCVDAAMVRARTASTSAAPYRLFASGKIKG
jgi:hypothetical protein